jgi:hypothetical protein
VVERRYFCYGPDVRVLMHEGKEPMQCKSLILEKRRRWLTKKVSKESEGNGVCIIIDFEMP